MANEWVGGGRVCEPSEKWDMLGSEGHVRFDEGLGVCIKTVSGQVDGGGDTVDRD